MRSKVQHTPSNTCKQHMHSLFSFFYRMNPPQCQAVHEVQGAAYTALVGSTGSQEQTTAPPQTRALYTIRHRVGQQGTKDKGTTGDKRQRDKAQQAHRHRKDNRGPKTEGQQGTKDRETNSFFFSNSRTLHSAMLSMRSKCVCSQIEPFTVPSCP